MKTEMKAFILILQNDDGDGEAQKNAFDFSFGLNLGKIVREGVGKGSRKL